MKLISLELKNIRSYKNEQIKFPEGVVLLAGDIGSGKSTILQAIEFAFFGLRRGSGSALLRHGSNEGKVKLSLIINNKYISIIRHLKRTNKSILQDSGYLLINNQKFDYTIVELKAKILELLGYPESLLSKNKDIIYRYTVYTPQEEMKMILFEKPEERLNIFRKLFDVDKYKLIRNNAIIYSRKLKNNIERLEGQTDDIDLLKKELEEISNKLSVIDKEKKQLSSLIDDLKPLVDEAKKFIKDADSKRLKNEDLKRSLIICETKKKSFIKEKESLFIEIKSLTKRIIDQFSEENKAINIVEYETKINNLLSDNLKNKKIITDNISKNQRSLGVIDNIVSESKKIIHSIDDIDFCPTCKQEVSDSHKANIRAVENNKIDKVNEKRSLILEQNKRFEKNLIELKKEEEKLRNKLFNLSSLKTRLELKKELLFQKEIKEKRLKEINDLIFSIDKEIDNIKLLPFDELEYNDNKKRLEEKEYQLKELEIKINQKITEQNINKKNFDDLKIKIDNKKNLLNKIKELNKKYNWLTKYFINLMFTIEKHLFISLYNQFNEYFKEWFDTLIEDDSLTVRLNESFYPIIEQNGYETFVENLSGGEKTSVALAYRLALNNLVNRLQNLNTKDIIILDEPTDGFSSEQLDRVKELIRKLDLKQIIIVSHEIKMESFVDHLIRIMKSDHESKVIYQ